MATLDEVRQQYPQYGDMSDQRLADALYTKFYSDIPREQFNAAVGLKAPKSFGDKVSAVWENPTPGGLPWLAKQAYSGIVGSVDAAKDATVTPDTLSTDVVRPSDLGPMYGAQAASVFSPMSRGGGLFGAAPAAAKPAPLALPKPASPVVEAANNVGIEIPQYLATENMAMQRLASGVKNVPISGDRIVKSANAVNEGLGTAARSVADQFGVGSVDVAGGAARDSIKSWIKTTSKEPLDAAYSEVERLIDPNIRAPLSSTADEVSRIMAERANAKIGGKSGAVQAVLPAVQSEGLNYKGAKDLRTFLGERTPNELIAEGINPKEAKRLYGALSDDLANIVKQSGGDDAAKLWREANALNVQTADQRKALAKIIGIDGKASPESVFSKLVSYAGSKSSADLNRLTLARKTIGPENWNEVASAVVARMGRDAQGNFSPDRFYTAYGNLSVVGKKTLFGGKPELAKSLDDINTVVGAIKDKIGRFANTSGTTQTSIGAGMVGGFMMDPLSLISSVVGGRALAEMLARPASAKATADYSKAYLAVLNDNSASKKIMLDVAARNLASVVGSNVKTVDVPTFLKILSGAAPAPAQEEQNKRSWRGNNQPDSYAAA